MLRELLEEKSVRDVYIAVNEAEKDTNRILGIIKRSKSYAHEIRLAAQMAKAIKNPDKAYARYQAALDIDDSKFTTDHTGKTTKQSIADEFLRRAEELGHSKAVGVTTGQKNVAQKKSNDSLKTKMDKVRPLANKFASAAGKKFSEIKFSVSTTCSYPTWNKDFLFVGIDGSLGDDAPYAGYTNDPQSLSTFKKSYLGNTLSQIVILAKKFGGIVYKDSGNFFVAWSLN